MFLVRILEMVAAAAVRIWSAGDANQFLTLSIGWVVGTVFLFAVPYFLTWILPGMVGLKAKWLGKVRGWVVMAHIAVALAPLLIVPGICCVAPCAILIWIGRAMLRGNRRQPRRNPRPAPRPRREAEDEDDADSDGEEDADTDS